MIDSVGAGAVWMWGGGACAAQVPPLRCTVGALAAYCHPERSEGEGSFARPSADPGWHIPPLLRYNSFMYM
jgi:hypothetical protein